MGVYLNSTAAYTLYKSETVKPYFVDKTFFFRVDEMRKIFLLLY